jgi:hypothetical protein
MPHPASVSTDNKLIASVPASAWPIINWRESTTVCCRATQWLCASSRQPTHPCTGRASVVSTTGRKSGCWPNGRRQTWERFPVAHPGSVAQEETREDHTLVSYASRRDLAPAPGSADIRALGQQIMVRRCHTGVQPRSFPEVGEERPSSTARLWLCQPPAFFCSTVSPYFCLLERRFPLSVMRRWLPRVHRQVFLWLLHLEPSPKKRTASYRYLVRKSDAV